MRAAIWAACLSMWSLAAHGTEFQRLSGHEITARFAGREFTDEHHFSEVFGGGGALVGTYLGARRPGGWRVSGDELCVTRGNEEERCFEVWAAGQRIELRQVAVDVVTEGILRRR